MNRRSSSELTGDENAGTSAAPDAQVRRAAPAPLRSVEPPYVRGRAEFYGAFADLAKGKRNWQLAAFASLGIAGVLAAGLVGVSMQSRIMPYVVQVDRLGDAKAFGPAQRLTAVDDRVIVRDLAGFLRDVRSVTADAVAQRDMVTRAFAFVDRGAAAFLNAYFTEPANDPRRLGRELTRLVEVTSVLPLPGASESVRTWKVSWTERAIPRTAGGLASTSAWEAYLTTQVIPPTRADERLMLNPLGVYVTQIHWTRLSGRTEPPVGSGPDSSAGSVPTQE